jgi:hypothetical protein
LVAPAPLRLTLWGERGSESRTVRIALFDPDESAAKLTMMVQLELPGMEPPQLSLSLKSPTFAPLNLVEFKVIAAALALATVMGSGLKLPTVTIPKDSESGETVSAVVPVPLSETVCGLPMPSSVTLRVALRLPVQPGVNVTVMVQLAPAARVVPQLLLCAKSDLSEPETLTLAMVIADELVLLMVVVSGALGVP